MLSLGLLLILPVLPRMLPKPGRSVVVIFPPWSDGFADARRVVAAGGALLGRGSLPWLIIARSDDPDFASELRQTGAWLVADAFDASGCSGSRPGAA